MGNSLCIPIRIHSKYVKMLYCFLFSASILILFRQTYWRDIIEVKPYNWPTAIVDDIVEVRHNLDRSKYKYMLLWTHPEDTPFIYFGQGSSVFINKTCKWSNCYVTGDRNILGDYVKFDAILFSSSRLSGILEETDIPVRRSAHQKYVFSSVESAAHYPITTNNWNGFFNWTWTYKLNSDAIWGYINIRNSTGYTVGPKQEMHWIDVRDMEEIDNDLRLKLQSKNRVAAWFVSNCNTLSRREEFVKKINSELNKYELSVDIYGSCGKSYCPKKIMARCFKLLEKAYFFYLAFENSFSEDYVTEKLLYALQHNTVPVVYGGANYSRFNIHTYYKK
ncbi:alpha-(1,3)-fucosyltransferase C-like isoform X2 [Plodia interpunctella]|uniref:alpha-(1,3)-fucosyltransferase C-like isoform X2 n=1 Tax=Plodia interpunctella TaxID=58824 RepID=UPI0023678D91|nr:alpha-(1,3)-fucosyltransferase C-like isoform X2 [Plodia interpunctella]